jgi:bifunctional ADP-heptose synthase (sugar kinase/adenylyltransferase)
MTRNLALTLAQAAARVHADLAALGDRPPHTDPEGQEGHDRAVLAIGVVVETLPGLEPARTARVGQMRAHLETDYNDDGGLADAWFVVMRNGGDHIHRAIVAYLPAAPALTAADVLAIWRDAIATARREEERSIAAQLAALDTLLADLENA